MPRMPHYCHAEGCEETVPRKMFMCRKHWFMVPMDLRGRLLAAYQPGQEKLKDVWPSTEYLVIAMQAVEAVALKECPTVTVQPAE